MFTAGVYAFKFTTTSKKYIFQFSFLIIEHFENYIKMKLLTNKTRRLKDRYPHFALPTLHSWRQAVSLILVDCLFHLVLTHSVVDTRAKLEEEINGMGFHVFLHRLFITRNIFRQSNLWEKYCFFYKKHTFTLDVFLRIKFFFRNKKSKK